MSHRFNFTFAALDAFLEGRDVSQSEFLEVLKQEKSSKKESWFLQCFLSHTDFEAFAQVMIRAHDEMYALPPPPLLASSVGDDDDAPPPPPLIELIGDDEDSSSESKSNYSPPSARHK